MIGKYRRSIVRSALSCAILLATPLTATAQAATAVSKLDLNSMTGTWSELAHLPNKAEKHCVSDASVLYALDDKPGRLQIISSCLLADGFSDVRNQGARVADKVGDGKLKIPAFLPLFLPGKKYWILANGPAYEWLLVGSPNHKTLLVLSRTKTLPPSTLSDIQARAAAQGFSVAKLIGVLQHP